MSLKQKILNGRAKQEARIKALADKYAAEELDWYTKNPLPADPGRNSDAVVNARLAEERRIRSVLGYASTIMHGGASLKFTPNSASLRLGGRS